MSGPPGSLAERIPVELDELERVLARVQEGWQRARTSQFDPAKIEQLVADAPSTFAQARAELLAFGRFLNSGSGGRRRQATKVSTGEDPL